MISGDLTVHSVHQITGEEVITGELRRDGARPIPFTSTRGDSVKSLVPEIAAELERQVRAFDRQHDAPVETVFRLVAGNATLVRVTLATLWPAAHARMLVERVQASRITRAAAIARITPAELAACGALVLDATSQRPIAQGLAASPGTAVGRLALPVDVESATDSDPRVLVIDDATPEDAVAIRAAVAILATSGGLTADAAIAARALRKPCVVSTPLRLADPGGPARGDWVTVDGSAGEVYSGALPTTWTPSSPFAAELITWLQPAASETPMEALLRAQKAHAQAVPR